MERRNILETVCRRVTYTRLSLTSDRSLVNIECALLTQIHSTYIGEHLTECRKFKADCHIYKAK